MAVAGSSRSLHASIASLDSRLAAWLACLALLTALNVALWMWMAWAGSPRTPYAEAQLGLSGVYVAVCGFRSLFPRVDLERVCLWDSWLSAVSLGRALATIAELCFAVQCWLFLQHLAGIAGLPMLAAAAQAFVPLAIVAEVLCWYAVLSLNHAGHAVEETLWAVMMLILAVATGTAALVLDGPLRYWLAGGALVYGVGAALTMAFDVTMYVDRWRRNRAAARLPLAAGLRDCARRRRPTASWDTWRAEAPWMTLYFSVGVWTSLAMVLLAWA